MVIKHVTAICAECRKRKLATTFKWNDNYYTFENLPTCTCSFCVQHLLSSKLLTPYCDRCAKAMGLLW